VALEIPYADIPGTTIFDLDQARKGYHLNQFCMSLMKPENRERFKANEAAYLQEWPMTPEQRLGVIARDWNRLISLGGNIFFSGQDLFDGRQERSASGFHDDRHDPRAICADDEQRRALTHSRLRTRANFKWHALPRV